jgi:hypothetical protein
VLQSTYDGSLPYSPNSPVPLRWYKEYRLYRHNVCLDVVKKTFPQAVLSQH